MKINLNKTQQFQQGGNMYLPSNYNPESFGLNLYKAIPDTSMDFTNSLLSGTSKNTGGSSTTKGSGSNIISDDLLKELSGKGLTNDVNAFTREVDSMYSNINPFSNGSLDTSSLARQHGMILSRVNELKNNKEWFDKSLTSAREKGAIGELAMTTTGLMLVQSEKGITQITPEKYYENQGKYRTISNAEIANLRMNSPNMAYDTSVFSILENAVSSKQVNEYIAETINNSNGKNVITNQALDDKTKAGLGILLRHETTTEKNQEQLNSAVNYLYNILPQNYKNFLSAQAAVNGINPNKGVYDMIIKYAQGRVVNKYEYKMYATKLPKTGGKDGRSGSGLGSNKTDKLGYEEMISTGTPYDPSAVEDFKLLPYNGTSEIVSTGTPYYPVLDTEHKKLPAVTTLNKVLQDTNFGIIGESDDITIGDKLISPTDLNSVVVTSNKVATPLLPSKTENGRVTVDYDSLNRAKGVIYEVLKNHHDSESIPTKEIQLRLREEFGNDTGWQYLRFTRDGNFTLEGLDKREKEALDLSSDFSRFLVLRGAAHNNLMVDSIYKEPLSTDEEDELVDFLEKLGEESSEIETTNWISNAWSGTNTSKVNIFMPIRKGSFAAVVTADDNMIVPANTYFPTTVSNMKRNSIVDIKDTESSITGGISF